MLHSLKKHKKIYVENLNWAKETDREPKYQKKEIVLVTPKLSGIKTYIHSCCLVAEFHVLLSATPWTRPPGSSVHGIFQPRILEWIAIPFSRGSSWLRDQTHVSCISRWIFYLWATREAQIYNTLWFLGSGNKEQIHWVVLAQGLSWDCRGPASNISQLDDCWQKASVLFAM